MVKKRVAKKAARKAAPEHGQHKSVRETRRTFEHLGRVQALSVLTLSERQTLTQLTGQADEAFRTERYKDAAELLRAAEHLSFASLHANTKEALTEELRNAISDECDHLRERAREHLSENGLPESLLQVQKRLFKDAKAAFDRGSFRAALEYARGAEALAHVRAGDVKALTRPSPQRRLPGE